MGVHLIQLVALEAVLVFEGESCKPPGPGPRTRHAPRAALAVYGVVHLVTQGAHLHIMDIVGKIFVSFNKILLTCFSPFVPLSLSSSLLLCSPAKFKQLLDTEWETVS